jgi:long-chain acyl-CoA synthetase
VEKFWLKNYVPGVPAEINPDEYSSLVSIFDESTSSYANNPAFYSMGTTITYKQIDQYSRAFAAYLQQVLKLKKGDRVAIMLPNLLQYPIAMQGVLRAGLIVVNVNPLYTIPELAHQLKDCGAETIIVLSNFAKTVQGALPGTAVKNIIVTEVGDMLPFFKAAAIKFFLTYVKKKIPAWDISTAISFKTALAKGKQLTLEPLLILADEIAFLQYTGGTTGVSKAAILSHRNIIANILQAEAWFQPLFKRGQEIIITALPLYHIFSLTANCLFLGKIGGLNVLIPNARDINAVVAEMKKFKFTVITGVNTLFNSLVKNLQFPMCDFSHFKVTLGGGMAVQRVIAERWQEITGVPILEAYGLTETSPCVSINTTDTKEYTSTVGVPVPSTLVKIIDNDGQEVPLGRSGEAIIKGPQVMRGYWQNPAETQKVFTHDGWLLTGDIASFDECGFLRILERKKDMILVSGFNVYPNEIEDVLVGIPGVREAAVVGVPDENSGEVPKAFLVLDDKTLTAVSIMQFCRTKLTGYKIPRQFEFCDELPKTNVGKVLRRALKETGKAPAS